MNHTKVLTDQTAELTKAEKTGESNGQPEKKINWGDNPKQDLPGKCAITITICNRWCHSITYVGNAQADTNFINHKKKINHLMYMDDITLFAKNEKELENLIRAMRIYRDDKRKEFGIEKCAMLIMKSRKWQMMEGIELLNQEKIRTLGENETYNYLWILQADTTKHAEIKGEMKKISQEKEKTARKQTTLQKSHQTDKYMGCPHPRKILGTILKVDERRTTTNGSEIKKINDDSSPREGVDRLDVPRKKEEEDSPEFKRASIHRYNDKKTI